MKIARAATHLLTNMGQMMIEFSAMEELTIQLMNLLKNVKTVKHLFGMQHHRRKKMNAEEMFKKLGYQKVQLISSGWIYYERAGGDEYFGFDVIAKEIGVSNYFITMEELKAINKQCEELGW